MTVESSKSGGPAAKRSSFDRLLEGDMGSLARALSILERGGSEAEGLAARLRPYTGDAAVVGFTGPPGSGKSTLIDAFVTALRDEGERVAVLAVDPSSPLTGGAVLGDRTRMGTHTRDDGVFIRSIASRGHLGGLSVSVPLLLDAVDAAGWTTIVLETVGTGQSEVEIVDFADITVVLSAPGLGDEVQAMKGGILEIADILVVNKSDLPFASKTRQQLDEALALRDSSRAVPTVVCTSATRMEGVSELVAAFRDQARKSREAACEIRIARRLRGLLRRSVEAEFHAHLARVGEERLDQICRRLRTGAVTVPEAARELLSDCVSGSARALESEPEGDHP